MTAFLSRLTWLLYYFTSHPIMALLLLSFFATAISAMSDFSRLPVFGGVASGPAAGRQ
jgi:hypothetical protein